MRIACTYREGDCWSVWVLPEFSVKAAARAIGFDPKRPENGHWGSEEMTVEHLPNGMTVITHFNTDGESCNWIAKTKHFRK